MSQFLSHSPAETEDFGFRLAQQLKGGEVIAMYGGMGMGKTAFTRGLARGLGIEYGISSPTFALVHEYTGRLTVYHFDMFRVERVGMICTPQAFMTIWKQTLFW